MYNVQSTVICSMYSLDNGAALGTMLICISLLGASLVHPRCIPGASLVHPLCIPAPLDLVPGLLVDDKKHRGFSLEFTMCPLQPPKVPTNSPRLVHKPSSSRFSDPQIHPNCLFVLHTRCQGCESSYSWLPLFIFLAVLESKLCKGCST